MTLLPPSGYPARDPDAEETAAPDFRLKPDWVYGYNGGTVASVHWISETEFVFPVAAVGVVQSLDPVTQRHFIGHSTRITCLAYNPARKLCASGQITLKGGGGPFVCLWRPTDCILLSTLLCDKHQGQICSLCLSPSGRLLFSLGRDSSHTLVLWDNFVPPTDDPLAPAPRELPVVFRSPIQKVPTGQVPAFGMSAMKTTVKSLFHFVIYDGGLEPRFGLLLKFYSLNASLELKCNAAIFGDPAPRQVLFCSWTSEARCIASCDNGYLYIFEGNAAISSQRISTSALGFCLELTDRRLVAGSRDSVLHFIPAEDAASRTSRHLRELGGRLVCSAGALPFGSASAGPALLVGSTNHHLLLMDLPEGRLKQVLHVGNAGEVHALAVHPSSDMQLFATGSSDATIRFWDARDHSPVVGRVLDYTRDQYWWPDGPVPKDGKGVYALAFSPSGKQFALGHGEGTIRLLTFPELQSKAVVCQSKLRERISVLEFVEENRLAAACWDQQIYIFDAPGLKCIRVLKGNSGGVTQLQVSSDRAFVMSNAKDGQVLFFDIRTGERVAAPAIRNQSWRRWCCPAGWATTGVWAANRSFCAPDVKCCTSLRALTALAAAGEVPKTGAAAAALSKELLVFGDTSHSVQLYSYPALEGQGHHSFDGHAGFVTTMVPLPRGGDPPEEQLITAGGDDHAIMQWSVGPQTDAPLWLRSTAWREVVAKQDRKNLSRIPTIDRKVLAASEATRTPWARPEEDRYLQAESAPRGALEGLPPFALHHDQEPLQHRRGYRPRGMDGSLEGRGSAGQTTQAKDNRSSLRRAATAAAEGTGVSTEAADSRTRRRGANRDDHIKSSLWQDKAPAKPPSGRRPSQ